MSVTVHIGDPRSPGATALLTASHAYLLSLYPPEHSYALSIDDLCKPRITFFVAHANGQTIGCAALADKDGYGEVKAMFVAPEGRGSGAGTALMAALEDAARAKNFTAMKLETGDTLDPAHRLYQRHGFEICGPFGDYADGPHSVFMEKAL